MFVINVFQKFSRKSEFLIVGNFLKIKQEYEDGVEFHESDLSNFDLGLQGLNETSLLDQEALQQIYPEEEFNEDSLRTPDIKKRLANLRRRETNKNGELGGGRVLRLNGKKWLMKAQKLLLEGL